MEKEKKNHSKNPIVKYIVTCNVYSEDLITRTK